ncbi:extensin family protein [Rhizobium oryzicola]|uniref:Extensin family protein n=1 Tax=Rhizobium oryzicola TaxID=1232668 RepID=A0ABT8SV15_9HYPH|nr:extensin family protein [Rhizobium oryzicola]
MKTLGASFEPLPRIDGEEPGCGIESPIRLESPLAGIKLSEPATMRCETALTLSHWLKETAEPALEVAKPGRKITVVNNAPGYSCRLRNNADTGKISEHARGNAVDIAGFTFDDGEKLIMTPKEQDPTMDGALQRTLTAGACLHFSTVLSPGSDASHKDHLHLDVLDRKKGYRFCR